MTQLVQSLLERLAQLPEPVQNRLATHFLKELEEAETKMAQQPRKRMPVWDKGRSSSPRISMSHSPMPFGLVTHEIAPRYPRPAVVA
jgi:hypothetical protein